MRSPFDITYDEIVRDPNICRANPMGKRRAMDGSLLLWEGRQVESDLRSAVFKVVLAKDNTLRFYKLNKRLNQWVKVDGFEPRRFFRRKSETVAPGHIRIEVFSNGNVKRTVG